MAYAVCNRARITSRERWRDNSMTGTLVINGSTFRYKTRGPIVKATNSQYSEINWKPEEGEEILFDGEIFKDQVVIDHIESWRPEDFFRLERHQSLTNRLPERIPTLPSMSKFLRHSTHFDEGYDILVARWMKPTFAEEGKDKVPVILTAICADNEIRFCARAKAGGELKSLEKVVILPIIAETLGIPTVEQELSSKAKQEVKPQHGNRIVKSSNKNKWIPGQPYRPEGMPEYDPFDDMAPALEVHSDIPF